MVLVSEPNPASEVSTASGSDRVFLRDLEPYRLSRPGRYRSPGTDFIARARGSVRDILAPVFGRPTAEVKSDGCG